MKKIMLTYPCGELFQRGEDRCQINVSASSSNSMRACNDLGIIASILQKSDYSVFLKDYQSEKLSLNDMLCDILRENPDIIFISTTNGSILDDLNVVKQIKKIKKDIVILLKGALFFNPDAELFEHLDLTDVDYLIGGEVEFIIEKLLTAHYSDKLMLANIEGISYKKNGIWISIPVSCFNNYLDEIPFPNRSLMNNSLYINPLTNKPMATISTSRGCPSSCIYCLSPVISGKKVRFRSSKNVVDEIKECVEKYQITDFFFKSDTFTINKMWVSDLCDLIIQEKLNEKINWCANSRVNTIDEEMLKKMKQAGCSLIALGIESGSNESLAKMKKGITAEESISTVKLIKKYGIKTFGFYMIGFPWENKNHLNDTKKLIFKLDTDFIEISIATPFRGSELYNLINQKQNTDILGKDSFKNIVRINADLNQKQLEKFRKTVLLKYHLRPSFILKKLNDKQLTKEVLMNYVHYGLRMIKNLVF